MGGESVSAETITMKEHMPIPVCIISIPPTRLPDGDEDVAAGITKANTVIRDMGGKETSPKATAPARAMGILSFILMDSYGDVPILDALPADGEAVERKPRAEVAKYIESELLDIIPLLSTTNNATTLRKTKQVDGGSTARKTLYQLACLYG